MFSLNFKSVALSLTLAFLASAAVPNARNVGWLQQNGPTAKALNDQYASLSTSSPCDSGTIACIGGEFAVCVQGRYITSTCPSGWTCAALPNRWSQGTTTTCDTQDDVNWRFSQAGVSESKRSATSLDERTSWLQQNGPAAKALNDQYASLTTSSSCSDGVACINGQFATCVEGSYLTWPCASDRTCAAIPNEWSEGTTTLCDTQDDINSRFSQAGVSQS